MEEKTEQTLDWDSAPDQFREHAESLERDLKELRSKLTGFERKEAFEKAASEVEGVEGLTLDDLGDIPTDNITPTLLRTKVAEQQEKQQATISQLAGQFGFENPDEFQKALESLKGQQEQVREQQTQAAGVAAVTSSTEHDETVKLSELEKQQAAGQVTVEQMRQLFSEGKVTDDAGEPIKASR